MIAAALVFLLPDPSGRVPIQDPVMRTVVSSHIARPVDAYRPASDLWRAPDQPLGELPEGDPSGRAGWRARAVALDRELAAAFLDRPSERPVHFLAEWAAGVAVERAGLLEPPYYQLLDGLPVNVHLHRAAVLTLDEPELRQGLAPADRALLAPYLDMVASAPRRRVSLASEGSARVPSEILVDGLEVEPVDGVIWVAPGAVDLTAIDSGSRLWSLRLPPTAVGETAHPVRNLDLKASEWATELIAQDRVVAVVPPDTWSASLWAVQQEHDGLIYVVQPAPSGQAPAVWRVADDRLELVHAAPRWPLHLSVFAGAGAGVTVGQGVEPLVFGAVRGAASYGHLLVSFAARFGAAVEDEPLPFARVALHVGALIGPWRARGWGPWASGGVSIGNHAPFARPSVGLGYLQPVTKGAGPRLVIGGELSAELVVWPTGPPGAEFSACITAGALF